MIELQDIITVKRELLSWETYSRNPINYSEGMSADQKDRYIQYLADQNHDLRLSGEAMKLVLDDFMVKIQELEGQMSAVVSNQAYLQKELSSKNKLCKSLERQLKSTQEKLSYANQQLFGERRQKLKSKTAKGKTNKADSDRRNEKDDYSSDDGETHRDAGGEKSAMGDWGCRAFVRDPLARLSPMR
ncbi:hypothetical protein AB9N12_19480 [Bacteroides sp. AN502(2024)]|uniref:hypothetical protein n=1 Tax=Bacteroides sp. AN502(2024) TaxID=3160599 RepID=UPI0035191D8F